VGPEPDRYAHAVRPQLEPFLARPGEAGVFLDFDGTLSEIVPVAADARPVSGATELLTHLGRKLALVAVVSGRSAAELLEWLGPDIEIWGVHGAQHAHSGRVVLSRAVAPYADLMRRVKHEAEREVRALELSGTGVEDKMVVVALHWRAAVDAGAAQEALKDLAGRLAERYGLQLAATSMTIELRPPVELAKSSVVLDRSRALDLRAVMFVGDDTVDLPAFDALDDLAHDRVTTVRVGVRWAESPRELLRRADIVVDGPSGVIQLLRELAQT
jgi:trehalose 6-phosphate phosphatase